MGAGGGVRDEKWEVLLVWWHTCPLITLLN